MKDVTPLINKKIEKSVDKPVKLDEENNQDNTLVVLDTNGEPPPWLVIDNAMNSNKEYMDLIKYDKEIIRRICYDRNLLNGKFNPAGVKESSSEINVNELLETHYVFEWNKFLTIFDKYTDDLFKIRKKDSSYKDLPYNMASRGLRIRYSSELEDLGNKLENRLGSN